MTSQYDIEFGIGKIQRMNFNLNELKKIEKPTKAQEKLIKDKTKAIWTLNTKLTNWSVEFDKHIKPLDTITGCENPDKIFVVRIPKTVGETQEKEYVEQYNDFITKQNYKIEGIDKQYGYITNIYSFFCTEIKK